MTPQWNADIITPEEKGSGTKVIGDNQQVQTTLESGENITIENGQISASGTLENVQADWTQSDSADPSYIQHKPNLATVATSGDYSDLLNRPDLSVYATTSEVADKADKVTGAVNGNLAGFDSSGNFADSGVASANLVHDASYVHTDNNFSNADVTKLSGIAAGAEVNVQSSWTETDTSSDAYIVGKPDLSIYAQSANLATVATSGSYNDLSDKPTIPAEVTVDQTYNASSTNPQSGTAVAGAIANKQDTISDLETIRTGAGLGATAVQPSDLATVATTGAYSDLSGTPTIPSGDQLVPSATSADNGKVLTVDNNGDPTWVTPSAGTVYTAGDGIDLTNNVISADVDGTTIGIDSSTKKIKLLSAIPTVDQTYNAASANAQSGVAVASAISTKQDTISDLATIRSGASAGATAVQPSSLATVATTGDYADLQNKPSIPAAQVNSDWNSSSGVSQILNKPTLATVATTGDYGDLLNKPSIPAAVTVDQTYNASSSNPQSGTAVAGAIAAISVDEVPTVTSSDDAKVLKATYSGGVGSYAWATETGTTYTAGDGIDLTNNVISADVDGTTIGIDSSTKKIKLLSTIPTVDQTYNASSTNAQSGVAVAGALASVPSKQLVAGSNITLTEHTNDFTIEATVDEVPAVTSSDDGKILKATYSGGSGSYAWSAEPTVDQTYNASSTNAQSGTAVAGAIAAISVDEVPAVTSSDDAKVLTATYSGGVGYYAWAAAQGGTTYSAGDGITISNDTIAADVDGSTIGIDSTTKKIKLLSAIPTVDQTYSASSTNAQSGTAVASAIAAVPTKPIVAGSNITITENTNNITLAATMPTVDQTYNSSSTNAQSGVAVASAISTAIGPIETALSNL